MAAAWLGVQVGIPVMITARGTDINLIPRIRSPAPPYTRRRRATSRLVTVCQALKDRLVELGVPDSKITVLRNGVDLQLFHVRDRAALRAKWKLQGLVLASVGLLIERKGHNLAIQALTQVPDGTLLIAGTGPDRQRLEGLAQRLGVMDRVRFLGSLDSQTLCEVYNCADALILASAREGWANVLLEAMACGTPVIASAVWGTPEVVNAPEAGLLLKQRDAASIVAAIAELRSAPRDRGCDTPLCREIRLASHHRRPDQAIPDPEIICQPMISA